MEWAAVHRKHHAFCEKEQDPHSPQHYGLWKVLLTGVFLYKKETKNKETLTKYGKFTPDDWIEHKLYRKHSFLGLISLLILNVVLFGYHGVWIYLLQIIWIPFWAAGIINGLAHFKGYRNFNTNDAATNIFPWGIIIGGEELHNNHHAYPASAKLSMKWYEFDIGWFWIQVLSHLKLAKVNKVYKLPTYDKKSLAVNDNSLDAFIKHRYLLWKMFISHTNVDVKQELKNEKLMNKELSVYPNKKLKEIFYNLAESLDNVEKELLHKLLQNETLKKIHDLKENLLKIWNNRQLNAEQLKETLTNWCSEAKHSSYISMQEFAQKIIWLRSAKLEAS